jgi:hypothetical protein
MIKAEAIHGCDNIYKEFLRYLSAARDCVSAYRQLIANFFLRPRPRQIILESCTPPERRRKNALFSRLFLFYCEIGGSAPRASRQRGPIGAQGLPAQRISFG